MSAYCVGRSRAVGRPFDSATLQGLLCAAFGGFPAYVVASSCPTAGSPLSRGCHIGRDAAVVSRRRLSLPQSGADASGAVGPFKVSGEGPACWAHIRSG